MTLLVTSACYQRCTWCGRRDLNSCVAPFCFPLIPHDCNDLAVLVVFANTSLNGCLDAYIISMVALWLRILHKLVAPRSCLYGLGYKCFIVRIVVQTSWCCRMGFSWSRRGVGCALYVRHPSIRTVCVR